MLLIRPLQLCLRGSRATMSHTDSGALSDSWITALAGVATASAVLSCLGSGFIIACYIGFPRLRKTSHQIFWLSISDVLGAFTYFIGSAGLDDPEGSLCIFQGFWGQLFTLASVLWTSCLAYHLYARVIKHQQVTDVMERRFHLFVWPFSLLASILPFTTDNYGPAGYVCWIDSTNQAETDSGTVWRYVAFYMWVWIALIFNAVMIFSIVRFVNRAYNIQGMPQSNTERKDVSVVNRLKLYPAVLLVVWFFPTVNRIHNSVAPSDPNYGLYVLTAIFGPAQGLFNCFVYGLTRNVRMELRRRWCASPEVDAAELEQRPPAAQQIESSGSRV